VFVSETGDLIIKVALSALRSQDVEITLQNKTLRIMGSHRDLELSNARQRLVSEIPTGPFERVLELPDGFNAPAAKAAYLNGILRIVVPRDAGPWGDPESQRRITFD
jgi:HSP20 family protein